MRLLQLSGHTDLQLITHDADKLPPYAILSHTWGADNEEVTFDDIVEGAGRDKPGYAKILFCGQQALRDGLKHFWVDTCCIDKRNHSELSEAIISMFRWYQKATKCYVYLSDVSKVKHDRDGGPGDWEDAFRKSRWFTRGCKNIQNFRQRIKNLLSLSTQGHSKSCLHQMKLNSGQETDISSGRRTHSKISSVK